MKIMPPAALVFLSEEMKIFKNPLNQTSMKLEDKVLLPSLLKKTKQFLVSLIDCFFFSKATGAVDHNTSVLHPGSVVAEIQLKFVFSHNICYKVQFSGMEVENIDKGLKKNSMTIQTD